MNILLIEDNLTIIKGLTYSFIKNNYNITSKTNIKDTIDYINNNTNINLIILDITLQDGNVITLYNNKILTSIIDLYKLKLMKDKIISLDGFGKTKFDNIIKSINSIKKANYATLFGSVGIQDVGVRMFQKIFKVISWKDLLKLVYKPNAVIELSQIPGIKDKTANKIVSGIQDNISLLEALTTIIKEDKNTVKYKCVFTGFRNNAFKQFLEKNWDTEVVDTVSKDVNLVIAESLDSNSSKIKKANKLNIPVMGLADAYNHFKYDPINNIEN